MNSGNVCSSPPLYRELDKIKMGNCRIFTFLWPQKWGKSNWHSRSPTSWTGRSRGNWTTYACFQHPGICSFTCVHPEVSNSLWPHGLYSPPGSSVCEISQAKILEWVAISSSRGSSWPRDLICILCFSYIGRQFLYHWATCKAQRPFGG